MSLHDDGGSADLAAIREAELRVAEQRAADSFEAYWAGSASASVVRDYAAGRATTHIPRTRRRRRAG